MPAAWWELTAAICKANGGEVLGPCGVGAYPDTTSAKRLLANVKTGLDAHMRDADLQPWATRKYFKAGAMNWYEEILGWSRLLMEEHLPFDFVVAERVAAPESLSRYQLVILPSPTSGWGNSWASRGRAPWKGTSPSPALPAPSPPPGSSSR